MEGQFLTRRRIWYEHRVVTCYPKKQCIHLIKQMQTEASSFEVEILEIFKTVVLLGLTAFSPLTLLDTTHKIPPQNVVAFGLAQLPVFVLPAFLDFIFQRKMEL